MTLLPVSEDFQPGALNLYFHSDDIDADMARVRELGGKVLIERIDVQGHGALGMFQDPTGNRVFFWQNADPSADS